jgi:hypothetical protein
MSLDNNKWAISTLLAVVGLIIPISLYFHSLPDTSLTYQVISKSELIGTSSQVDGLVIKIKDTPIEKANIYLLKIKNDGTLPITKSDYERDMLIKFAVDENIFNINIKNKYPENLSVIYETNKNTISIKPLLLNPDDEFDVEILSSSDLYPRIDARISGLKNINELLPASERIAKTIVKIMCFFFLIVFYAKHLSISFSNAGRLSNPLVKVSNITLSATCAFSSVAILETIAIFNLQNNKIYIIIALIIPVVIGMQFAKREIEYNKSSNLTGEKDSPSS